MNEQDGASNLAYTLSIAEPFLEHAACKRSIVKFHNVLDTREWTD